MARLMLAPHAACRVAGPGRELHPVVHADVSGVRETRRAMLVFCNLGPVEIGALESEIVRTGSIAMRASSVGRLALLVASVDAALFAGRTLPRVTSRASVRLQQRPRERIPAQNEQRWRRIEDQSKEDFRTPFGDQDFRPLPLRTGPRAYDGFVVDVKFY